MFKPKVWNIFQAFFSRKIKLVGKGRSRRLGELNLDFSARGMMERHFSVNPNASNLFDNKHTCSTIDYKNKIRYDDDKGSHLIGS